MLTDKALRLGAVGALSGFLAAAVVGLPALAAAHAVIVSGYHETARDFMKLSSCSAAPYAITCMPPMPSFWSEVLPVLNFGPIFFALLGGAALGVVFVLIRALVPAPSLVWAPAAGILYSLPALLGGSLMPAQLSPWESAFAFVPYPGMVTEWNRLLLIVPDIAGAVAIAILVYALDRWLPSIRGSLVRWACAGLTLLACLALPLLLVSIGAFPIGGD